MTQDMGASALRVGIPGAEKSRIVGCHLVARPDQSEPMFDFDKKGRAIVRLDGMLIAPLSLFSKRQLQGMSRRARAQAIEARRAETGEDTGSVHESAVPSGNAPNPDTQP